MKRAPDLPPAIARLVAAALAPTRAAHERQRDLVRASLIARPVKERDEREHRRRPPGAE